MVNPKLDSSKLFILNIFFINNNNIRFNYYYYSKWYIEQYNIFQYTGVNTIWEMFVKIIYSQ
jgi:hypothetical protein